MNLCTAQENLVYITSTHSDRYTAMKEDYFVYTKLDIQLRLQWYIIIVVLLYLAGVQISWVCGILRIATMSLINHWVKQVSENL